MAEVTDAPLAKLQRYRTALGKDVEIRVFESDAGDGGGATEALTFTGLLADDTILSVTQKTAGANDVAIISYTTQAADALTVAYTADPGAGSVVKVVVLREKK